MKEECVITITRDGDEVKVEIKGKMQPFHVLQGLNQVEKSMLTRAHKQYMEAKERACKDFGGLKVVAIIRSDSRPAPEKPTPDPRKN